MICWKCGNQIDEGSLFCPYCGSQQAQQSGPVAGQQMQGDFSQQQMGVNSPQQQMGTNPAPQQMGMNPAPQQNGGNGSPKGNKEPQSHVGMMVGAICASLAALMLIGLVILMVVRGNASDDHKERRTEKTTEQASATSTEATTEAASTEAETEAATETAEVDDATLESASAAYLKILNDHSSAIEAYNWQRGYNSTYSEPVTIEDINGDGIPELIFFEAENEYLAGYYIYGFKNGEAVMLSDIQDIDAEVAGGTVYYVGALKDSNDLFVYHSVTDEGSEEFFYEMNLTEDGLYKKGAEYQRNAFPTEDYTSMNVTYYKDGAEISESDFNDFVNSKQDNIRTFISYSEGEDIANLVDLKGSVCVPMDRAKEELGGDSADTETAAASDGTLPLGGGMEFCFSSGAGGWGTYMTIKSDGSFVGNYHDSDMGDIGEGYPNGIIYFCNFSGQFKNITKVDDYTYKMELDSYDMENEVGTEEIKDEMKYVYSAAYGIDGGKTFYLYLPGKPVSELSEGFISWSYGVVGDISKSETLEYYGLHNVEEDEGFFVYTY